jgi:hypothetical protein
VRRYLVIAVLVGSLGVAAAAWAAPLPDTTFKGKTSQKQRVSVRSSADGLKLRNFTITREFDCGAGVEPVVGTFRQSAGAIVVNANGVFRARGKVKGAPAGRIASGQFRFRGQFGPRGRVATGAYRERVELDDGTECGTRRVTFRVRAR